MHANILVARRVLSTDLLTRSLGRGLRVVLVQRCDYVGGDASGGGIQRRAPADHRTGRVDLGAGVQQRVEQLESSLLAAQCSGVSVCRPVKRALTSAPAFASRATVAAPLAYPGRDLAASVPSVTGTAGSRSSERRRPRVF